MRNNAKTTQNGVAGIHIVAQENVHGAMSCNLHGGGHINARVDEVTDGRATEIIGDEPLVFIPGFAGLYSESGLYTSLDPLTPEILDFKNRAIPWNFLFSMATSSSESGTINGLRFLSVPDGKFISCSTRFTTAR
jgi:hypothetical protein